MGLSFYKIVLDLSFDSFRRNTIAPSNDVKLSSLRIAHQLGWIRHKMNEVSLPARAPAVRAVNNAFQFAQLHHNRRYDAIALHPLQQLGNKRMKSLKQAHTLPNWLGESFTRQFV